MTKKDYSLNCSCEGEDDSCICSSEEDFDELPKNEEELVSFVVDALNQTLPSNMFAQTFEGMMTSNKGFTLSFGDEEYQFQMVRSR